MEVLLLDFVLLVILFVWFTLILTGIKIGKYTLCWSSIKEREKPEIIMWLVFLVLIFLYVIFPIAGNIAMILFLLMWIIAQWFMTLQYIFFPNEKKIKGYNKYFEDMHHIIKPSEKRLVPDTYHIVLFALIIICIIATIINLAFSQII